MHRVKSSTGTALGSRNALCLSVCYEERKRKRGWPEFAAGSWLPCPPGNSSRASREAAAQERSGDICQGAGDANLQVHPPYYSPPVVRFVVYTFPSIGISCFFPACGSVNLRVTLPRTQPPSLSLLLAPAILLLQFHIVKDPVTNPMSSWPFTPSFMPFCTQQESYLLAPGILLPLD